MWRGEGVGDLVILQCGIQLCCLIHLLPTTARTSKRRLFTGLSVIFLMPWRKMVKKHHKAIQWGYTGGICWAHSDCWWIWPEHFPIWARENVSLLISIRPFPREPGMGTWPGHSLRASYLLPCPLRSLSPEKPHATDGRENLEPFSLPKNTRFLLPWCAVCPPFCSYSARPKAEHTVFPECS